MYEGTNIHFSPFDNKPLCSYSNKLCKQRRLNGYAFCVRHILEDQGAPYKQCCYVSKYSKQTCINPIPKAEERLYCNSHLQVLGLIPKKEKKQPKEKIKEVKEIKEKMREVKEIKDKIKEVNEIKEKIKEVKEIKEKMKEIREHEVSLERGIRTKFSKFTMRQNSECLPVRASHPEEDPYAFPEDPVAEKPKTETTKLGLSPSHPVNTFTDIVNMNPSQGTQNHLTPKSVWSSRSISVEKSPVAENGHEVMNTSESGFSIAKLYPELAEKLERTKLKAAEPQQRKESKSFKSQSRTMNRLQTKIAQNKIKDKLKRNLSNHTTPEHQPSTPQTPSSVNSNGENGVTSAMYSQKTQSFNDMPSAAQTEKTQLKVSAMTTDDSAGSETESAFVSIGHVTSPSAPRCDSFGTKQMLLQSQDRKVTSSHPGREQESTPQSLAKHCHTVEHHAIGPPAPPPPRYFTSMPPPSIHQPTARLPVLYSKPRKTRNVLSEKEARKRLKRPCAVKAYAYHASQKMLNNDLLKSDVDSSSDESDGGDILPWQNSSFSLSSDEEEDSHDDSPVYARITKISLLRSRIRRQFMQLRRSVCANLAIHNYEMKALQAMVESARQSPMATCTAIKEMKNGDHSQATCSMEKKYCVHTSDEVKCQQEALPYTNHCTKHIMHNVDQQLFDFCTAKFSDNTQCCVAVFDTRHELPLCREHAAKADNYTRNLEPKQKKPRKKTKPSALTRPPKRGKKKKNQKRNLKPQKPMPPLEPTGNIEMPKTDTDLKFEHDSPVCRQDMQQNAVSSNHIDTELAEVAMAIQKRHQSAQTPDPDLADDLGVSLSPSTIEKTLDLRSIVKNMDLNSIEKNLDFDKNLDIRNMEKNLDIGTIEKDLGIQVSESVQGPRFLDVDEKELHAVLEKLPEDAFDLFTERNGEYLPTTEETEELERALAQASKEVVDAEKTLEQFSQDTVLDMGEDSNGSDELTKQIADTILNQHLSPSESITESITDELCTDNINALASSISANDLKNLSQELTTTDLNRTITQQQQQHTTVTQHEQQDHLNRQGKSKNHLHQNTPAMVGQLVPGQRNEGVHTSGGFSVIQAQLNQGPLAPLQLQLNHTNKLPGVATLQRPLSSNPILVQQTQTLPPLTLPNPHFRPVMNHTNFTPVSFQNGFPFNHQGPFPIQALPGSGVKVAYPVQMIQAQPVTMAPSHSQIGQNNVPSTQQSKT